MCEWSSFTYKLSKSPKIMSFLFNSNIIVLWPGFYTWDDFCLISCYINLHLLISAYSRTDVLEISNINLKNVQETVTLSSSNLQTYKTLLNIFIYPSILIENTVNSTLIRIYILKSCKIYWFFSIFNLY